MSLTSRKKALVVGSFIFGFGFMGAMDGIIYHQLLQWHSVIMETSRPGQILSDGIFHMAVTVALVAGGIILWLAGNPREHGRGVRKMIGWFLIGAGLFNLIEGIINHHILKIHRVKPSDPNALLFDIGFLVLGAVITVIGILVQRSRERQSVRKMSDDV
ncbi:MAG: DUF2243 domain-containing protein [Bacillus sp. (in: firmicutes)]